MQPETIVTTYFSPTGTSKKVADAIANGLGAQSNETLDLTSGSVEKRHFSADEFCIFSFPVYAGRVASQAVERMEGITAKGTPAVAVVLYGNREYEDALLELKNLLSEKGFNIVGAAAFIGEHSFSTPTNPVAPGRPDEQDIEKALRFGQQIAQKDSGIQGDLTIPGNFPYKDGMQKNPVSPEVDHDKCVLCGTCQGVCPVGAVSMDERVTLDGKLCILCCACIKNCPEQALAMTAPPMIEKAQWLSTNYSARKEPELFL